MTMRVEKSVEANSPGLHDAKILDPPSDTSSENLPPYRKRSRRREIIAIVAIAILLGCGLIAVLVYFSAKHVFYEDPEAIVQTTVIPMTSTDYVDYDSEASNVRARGIPGLDSSTVAPVREHRNGPGLRRIDLSDDATLTTTEEPYDPSMKASGFVLRRGLPNNQPMITTPVSTDDATVVNERYGHKGVIGIWMGYDNVWNPDNIGVDNNDAVDRGALRNVNASHGGQLLIGDDVQQDNTDTSGAQQPGSGPPIQRALTGPPTTTTGTPTDGPVNEPETDNQSNDPRRLRKMLPGPDQDSNANFFGTTPSQETAGGSSGTTPSQETDGGSSGTTPSQDTAGGSSGSPESLVKMIGGSIASTPSQDTGSPASTTQSGDGNTVTPVV